MDRLKTLFKRDILKEVSWYTLSQIVVQILAFLGVIVTSRYLGPTNVGLYSFVQNYAGVFMAVASGMDYWFTWKIAKSEDKMGDLREYTGHKFSVIFCLSVLGIALAWCILPGDVAFLSTLLLVPLFLQSFSSLSIYAVVNRQAKIVASTQIISAVSIFILKILLVIFNAPLSYFIIVGAFDLVIVSTFFMGYFLRQNSFKECLALLKFPGFWKSVYFMYSIKITLITVVLWQLLLRVDQLVLAAISNAHSLGIYSSAVKIAEVPNFLAGVLYTALVSRIANISKQEPVSSKKNMARVMYTYSVLGVAVALFIVVFAPVAVNILYGDKFIEAIPVLRVYALSIPGMFLSFFFFSAYAVKGRHHYQIIIYTLALFVNASLVWVLTPLFGLMGTALATVAAYTIAPVLFYFNLRR